MAGGLRGLSSWLRGGGGTLRSILAGSQKCSAGWLPGRATYRPVLPQTQHSLLPAPSARLLSSGSCLAPLLSSCNSSLSNGFLRTSTPTLISRRTKISYSLKTGKSKTVKPVVRRFLRLNWGIWIRPRAGRAKKLWTKSRGRQYRLKQHVFCNKQQSKMLDEMVTDYWKKPRHYVNDPYAPYQKRVNFPRFFPEKPKFLP